MPGVLLPIAHQIQSFEATCLPASIQMVLGYLGREISESRLIRVLNTDPMAGTPFPRITRVERFGCRVELVTLDASGLRQKLHNRQPLITPLWTEMLPYWSYGTAHVAVVVGYDDRYVYLNDPAFAVAPQRVLCDGFLAAWEEYDRMAAIISL